MDMREDASVKDLPIPDTPAATAATQVARRYCSSALYAHSVRSYLWAVAYAGTGSGDDSLARGRLADVDLELLYVAAMLHDLGLTRPFDAHEMPFEEAGGQVAWVFAAAAGWSDPRRTRVTEVIERHMWPAVDPDEDLEGHLLEVGTGIDISGRGVEDLPTGLVHDVLAAWPRLDLAAEFTDCFRRQASRKPRSRAADLLAAGLADRLAHHPLEAVR
jgi:hypothetical protein